MPKIKPALKNFQVFFKRKGEKEVLAGDSYYIDAINVNAARKETRQLLKERFFTFDVPTIAWVTLINPDGSHSPT